MKKESNKVLISGIWYTISNFFLKGIVFITTPIFARLLTQAEFGTFTNYTSWINILLVFTTLNVEATLISARYEHEDELDEYISSMLLLSMTSTLLWWLGANVFAKWATSILNMTSVQMNLMFAYLFTLPAINLFQSRERFFYKYKVSVALSIILSLGSSLLSVALVFALDSSLDGRIIGYIVPNVIVGIGLIVYLLYLGRKICIKFWKEALRIVLPFIPHLLSLSMLNQMDRIMITKICGESDTALYGLAYNVALIITLLLTSLNGAFSPWLGENLARKEYKKIKDVSKGYVLLFVYFAMGIMLLAPELLLVLGGKSYIEAKWVMVPVAVGCICQFIYTLFVNVEQFEKKTMGMAFASVSAALLNYILNATFIPRYGYIAAAFTTLAGYLWLLLVHMFLVYKMKMGQVYSYRFILVVIVVSLVISGLMYVLYNATLIRYAVIVLYGAGTCIVAWCNKEKIRGYIKK